MNTINKENNEKENPNKGKDNNFLYKLIENLVKSVVEDILNFKIQDEEFEKFKKKDEEFEERHKKRLKRYKDLGLNENETETFRAGNSGVINFFGEEIAIKLYCLYKKGNYDGFFEVFVEFFEKEYKNQEYPPIDIGHSIESLNTLFKNMEEEEDSKKLITKKLDFLSKESLNTLFKNMEEEEDSKKLIINKLHFLSKSDNISGHDFYKLLLEEVMGYPYDVNDILKINPTGTGINGYKLDDDINRIGHNLGGGIKIKKV